MTLVRLSLRRGLALLRAQYAYMTEYRAELILWALSMSLSFILMGVWFSASGRADIGISQTDVVRYFFCVFLVRQLTVVWVVWDVEAQVVEGKLSSQLLLPIDPVWRHLAGHVAERFARLPFVALLVVGFFALYPTAFFVPSPSSLALFLAFSLAAFLLRFVMQYTVAMGCFWLERATAIETLHFLLYLFASGAIAPLEVFPEPVRQAVMYSPFPYMLWLPARALLGEVPTPMLVQGAVVMSVWGAAFFVLNRFLWRRGLRRYSAMGA